MEYINTLAIIVVILFAILLTRLAVLKLYKTRKKINTNNNFVIGVNTITLILIIVLLFLGFLTLMNIDIKQFFTSLSIIAAAIAILSKDYISNAINGMILMFNSHISIDDYVKIGDTKGKIIHLSLMNVHLINEENDLVLVPNNLVLATQIINYTKGETRKAQLELPLPPSMTVDINQTEALFKEAVKAYQHKAIISSLKIRINKIEQDVVFVKVSILLHESDSEVEKHIRRSWLSTWADMKQKLEIDIKSK